jgi:hypothetical protein
MRFVVLALLLAGAAQAQVYKCPDVSGKIVYSQAPCANGGVVLDRQKPPSFTDQAQQPLTQRREVDRAARIEQERAAAVPAPAVIPGQGGNCPSEDEIRNMETSASAKYAKGRDTQLLARQAAAARACRAGRGPYDPQAVQRQVEAERADAKPMFCHGTPNTGAMFCQKQ